MADKADKLAQALRREKEAAWSARNAEALGTIGDINQFLPVTGDIQSGVMAAQDVKNKKYASALMNSLGLLPFVPAMGGMIKEIPNKKLFFHVTDANNVPNILKEGILPNKVEGATYGALGQKLSDKGKVYAFDNLNDAIRWQKSKDWANENPQQGLQIIPFFDNPAHYERDMHPELFDYVGPLKKKGSISPEQIATTQFTKPIDKLEQGQKVGEYSLDELAQYGVIPNLNEARMLYKGYGTKADTKNMITPESLGLVFK